jgi:hypothetical protein
MNSSSVVNAMRKKRVADIIKGAGGKRLTYRRTDEASHP